MGPCETLRTYDASLYSSQSSQSLINAGVGERISMLSSVGLILGLISVARGVKGGLRGENYAMVGTLLCAASLGITVTLNQALRYVQWDTLPYMF